MKKLVKAVGSRTFACRIALVLYTAEARRSIGNGGFIKSYGKRRHGASVGYRRNHPGARRRQRRRRKAPERRMSIPLRILWSPEPEPDPEPAPVPEPDPDPDPDLTPTYTPVVLMYHLIMDEPYSPYVNLFVRPKDFAAQMDILNSYGYTYLFAVSIRKTAISRRSFSHSTTDTSITIQICSRY